MNFFENVDPFSKKNIINLFLNLIKNKDKQYLLQVKILLEKRLIELNLNNDI
tara:strand:+ start:499 stop:654 length:156 start_codon:yes stop_codon:yes gene_type:complete